MSIVNSYRAYASYVHACGACVRSHGHDGGRRGSLLQQTTWN